MVSIITHQKIILEIKSNLFTGLIKTIQIQYNIETINKYLALLKKKYLKPKMQLGLYKKKIHTKILNKNHL